jgi:hypothetical protein
MPDIILENEFCRLTLGEDAVPRSLILKADGADLLSDRELLPFFSVTQDRPFNNEVKLAHPNKKTVFPANRVRAEKTESGWRLTVGFELAPYEALVDVTCAPRYLAFRLTDFLVPPDGYPGLCMATPPTASMRLAQFPIPGTKHFGAWLNVSHDDAHAVALIAGDPRLMVDSEKRRTKDGDYRILTAEVRREIGLKNIPAVLIASPAPSFLDAVDDMERDLGLPRGVESRRSDAVNASIYWTADCTPLNVDEHIRYAKMGGFRLMLLYYTSLFREKGGYALNGDYDWRDEYPEKKADLRKMLEKIKAAGITPGLHFLQTHIGLSSRYCTPDADGRLNLTRRFTLSADVGTEDTEIPVEQNPDGCVADTGARILSFGGELIFYEGYTAEKPCRFTGCTRGCRGTTVRSHPKGERGGLLDVSEFGASSCYLDQETSLGDEVADKIADVWNEGFRFCYFDGSEGTNAPYEYYVPLGQYRVWKKFSPAPLFTEGAAKAHFSWHHLSGGNAFDIFPPSVFKDMIRKYPAEEAPRMREDFTRLNFGWWGFWTPAGREDGGTQADLVEFGTSRAAAWDCPVTVQTNLSAFRSHPRIRDIMEVFRRWEDVRARHLLTDGQKAALKDLSTEHVLLKNKADGYDLLPCREIETGSAAIRAFLFEREGRRCVIFWHLSGEGTLRIALGGEISAEREADGEPVPFCRSEEDGAYRIPVADKVLLTAAAEEQAVLDAFRESSLV